MKEEEVETLEKTLSHSWDLLKQAEDQIVKLIKSSKDLWKQLKEALKQNKLEIKKMKRPIIIGRLVPFEKVKCKDKEIIKIK